MIRENASGIYSLCMHRPVATFMTVVAVMVFGTVSLTRLEVALLPDISFPTITVRTELGGAPPAEIEAKISIPVEDALGNLRRLERLSSRSQSGKSDVILEFAWGADLDLALVEISERLDRLYLPDGARRPIVLRYDPAQDPILRIGIQSSNPEIARIALRRIAEEEVERRLAGLEGVAAVHVVGGREEEIQIAFDEKKLRQSGLDLETINARLARENINLASGTLTDAGIDYVVRTLNEFADPAEIEDLIVAERGAAAVRIRDLATVRRHERDPEVLTRMDGAESVEIEVQKEADANAVTVSKLVRARLDEITVAGVEIKVLSDQSRFISSAIDEVKSSAFQGAVLAIIVLMIFLRRAGPTIAVATSIPISVVATFVPMQMAGASLNVMSLGGLALGIGMLVDNAIVVLESITRCREEGDDLFAAAERGTREVGAAVIASTLTTIAVFFPIVFVEGIAGQIFRDQALTVVFSLMASLIVALFFIPMLASRQPPRGLARPRWPRGAPISDLWRGMASFAFPYRFLRALFATIAVLLTRSVGFFLGATLWVFALIGRGLGRIFAILLWPFLELSSWMLTRLNSFYPRALTTALAHRGLVLIASVALFAASLYHAGTLGSELVPEVHQGELILELAAPPGTPIERTDALVMRVEEMLADREDVAAFTTRVGVESATNPSSDEGSFSSRILVTLADSARTEEGHLRLRDEVNEQLQVPGIESARFRAPALFSIASPIEVEISGHELPILERLTREVEERVLGASSIDGRVLVGEVRSSIGRGAREVLLSYDRDLLARYSLSTSDVAEALSRKVAGATSTALRERDRRIDIVTTVAEDDRDSVDDVLDLVVAVRDNLPIRVRDLTSSVVEAEGPAEIRRINHRRAAVVTATPVGLDLASAVAGIESALVGLEMPEGFKMSIGGQRREMQRSSQSLIFALALAAFLVYVVMASLFENLLHPLVIMVTLPLALVGVVAGLTVTGTPISVLVLIGLIVLAGIVVNNAIVLIDYANQLRHSKGLSAHQAIVEAGAIRLRPILMTALTTIVALVPTSLGFGEGAELRAPLAVAIVWGLSSATVLTLVVIPIVYTLVEDLADRVRGRAPGAPA